MNIDIEHLAVDNYPCAYCRAEVGFWCVTKSNRQATSLHAARTWPLYQVFGQAWNDGWEEGRDYEKRLQERQFGRTA